MKWILPGLYALLLVFMYYFSGFWAAIVVSAGLFISSFNLKNRPVKRRFTYPVFLLFLYIFLNVDFSAYAKGSYLSGFLLFVIAAVCVYIMMNMADNDDDSISRVTLEYKKQNIFIVVFKALLAGAAVIIACPLIDPRAYNTIYLYYIAAFVALGVVFHNDIKAIKSASPAGLQDDNAKNSGINVKIRATFMLIMVIILAYKSYNAMMADKVKDSLFYLTAAAFFIKQILLLTAWAGDLFAEQKKYSAIDFVLVIIFIGFAYYLRVRDLANIPPGIQSDDVILFDTAIQTAYPAPFIPDMATNGPTLMFWMLKEMAVFTNGVLTLYTLRLFGVFWGVLNVAFIYLLALELFNRRTAIISAFLMSVAFIHLLYSSVSVGWIIPAACATASFYFYLVGIRKGNAIFYILSGLFLGLGPCFYHAGKLMPFIMIAYIIMSLIFFGKNRAIIVNRMPGILLMIFTAALADYPVITYAIKHPAEYFLHISDVSNIRLDPSGFAGVYPPMFAKVITALFKNSNALGIMSMPSSNVFGAMFSIFLVIGIALTIFSIKKHSNLFLLAWLLIGFAGGVFSSNPYGIIISRSVLLFPALFLLAGAGIGFSADLFEKILGTPGKLTAPLIIACLLGGEAFANMNAFYNTYKNDPVVKSELRKNLFDIADMAAGYKKDKVLLSEFYFSQRCTGIGCAMEWRGSKYDYFNPQMLQLDKIYNNEGKRVLLITEGIYSKNIDIYREYFPNARIKIHWNYGYWIFGDASHFKNLYGWNDPDYVIRFRPARWQFVTADPAVLNIDFISVEIPYSDIEALYGLDAGFYRNGSIVSKSKLNATEIIKDDSFDTVRLEGVIEAPYTGIYNIDANGASVASLIVNDMKTDKNKVFLVEGLNKIKITIGNFKKIKCFLMWKDPSGKLEQIPEKNTISPHKIFGLDEKIIIQGKTIYKFQDYAISNRIYWYYKIIPDYIAIPKADLFERKWDGKVSINESDKYTFSLLSPFESEIIIDGKSVFKELKDNSKSTREIYLNKGSHKISVSQQFRPLPEVGNIDYIKLLYKRHEDKLPTDVMYYQLSQW